MRLREFNQGMLEEFPFDVPTIDLIAICFEIISFVGHLPLPGVALSEMEDAKCLPSASGRSEIASKPEAWSYPWIAKILTLILQRLKRFNDAINVPQSVFVQVGYYVIKAASIRANGFAKCGPLIV